MEFEWDPDKAAGENRDALREKTVREKTERRKPRRSTQVFC